MNPHQITRDFEKALCEYTGAPFAVTTTSCTMALLLAVAWHMKDILKKPATPYMKSEGIPVRNWVEIPKRTYVSVPMSIIHAGGRPTFRDEDWLGAYQLKPLPVWDSARWFTGGMWNYYDNPDRRLFPPGSMICVSFHSAKTLGDTQGGTILHDDPGADKWLRRARFDGRAEGIAPKNDTFDMLGWHCYMSPDVAARLLLKLSVLPKHNNPLPWGPGTDSDYPDLSQMEIFR